MSMMMLLTMSFVFVSCQNDDDETVVTAPVSVKLEMPLGYDGATLKEAKAVLTDKQTSRKYEITEFAAVAETRADAPAVYVGTADVPVGNYHVEVAGVIDYSVDGMETTREVTATYETTVKTVATGDSNGENTFTVPVQVASHAKGGFVISEICIAGTLTPAGKTYNYDGYFVITNNSDKVLYADSIAILETMYVSGAASHHEYTPNIIPTAFGAGVVYMIPGNGKSVKVNPGESVIIANNAIDHTAEANANSYNLSTANFELYDQTDRNLDTDNPLVTNMEKWYCYSATIWMPSVQMNRSYAIAKMRGTAAEFVSQHYQETQYVAASGKQMVAQLVSVPNEWILDAVNLSIKDDHDWSLLSPSLDAGFTYCLETFGDKTARGTAVVRKKGTDGKYIDTDNSTNDFTPRATPRMKLN